MSAAAPALHRPGPFTVFPPGAAVDLGRAARRMIDKYLWKRLRFGELDEELITDREIAEEVGCSIRTAQEAVRQACERVVDGIKLPIIERTRKYGPKHKSGRILRFVAPEIVPVPVEEPAPAPAKGRRKAAPGPAVTVPATPLRPEQVIVHARNLEKAAPKDDAPEDPAALREAIASVREAIAGEAPRTGRYERQMEARRRRAGLPTGPALAASIPGPEVPSLAIIGRKFVPIVPDPPPQPAGGPGPDPPGPPPQPAGP